jgi:DNA-binding NarL/FixJ family response regulator
VLLTAYDDHEQIIHATGAGAAAYCARDIDPLRVVQTVKKVVNGKFVIENRFFPWHKPSDGQ